MEDHVYRYVNWIIICLVSLAAAGCAAVVVGAGASAYTYIQGELKRSYTVDYDRAVTAAGQALEQLKISVTKRDQGATETQFTGVRTDENPVTVVVSFVGPELTDIGVRSGIVGYWDKSGSELIHATIAKRLQ